MSMQLKRTKHHWFLDPRIANMPSAIRYLIIQDRLFATASEPHRKPKLNAFQQYLQFLQVYGERWRNESIVLMGPSLRIQLAFSFRLPTKLLCTAHAIMP